MTGIQSIPLRIPEIWDAQWFAGFVRDVLVNVDVRNATGTGLTISSNPDDPASLVVEDIGITSLQDISQNRILGRVTAGTGSVEQLTAENVRTVAALASVDNVTFNSVDLSTTGVKVTGTKVLGKQGAAIASLTDSTSGTTDGTLSTCGNTTSSDQSGVINNNFAELHQKVDSILSALRAHGLIDT